MHFLGSKFALFCHQQVESNVRIEIRLSFIFNYSIFNHMFVLYSFFEKSKTNFESFILFINYRNSHNHVWNLDKGFSQLYNFFCSELSRIMLLTLTLSCLFSPSFLFVIYICLTFVALFHIGIQEPRMNSDTLGVAQLSLPIPIRFLLKRHTPW